MNFLYLTDIRKSIDRIIFRKYSEKSVAQREFSSVLLILFHVPYHKEFIHILHVPMTTEFSLEETGKIGMEFDVPAEAFTLFGAYQREQRKTIEKSIFVVFASKEWHVSLQRREKHNIWWS